MRCPGFLILLSLAASAAAADPLRPWTPALLQETSAWPHAERDARIAVTPQGLRVEIAEGRTFAIAAASQLALPADLGRMRVRVATVGGGARWFVRLYGELRERGWLAREGDRTWIDGVAVNWRKIQR